jgi:hypothetical protein
MVLAVDAGHQMKKDIVIYVLTIIGGMIFVGPSLGMEKFQGNMVL